MTNTCLAMLGQFEKIKENEEVEFLHQRGEVMVMHEVWNIWSLDGFDDYFPEWLQVLVFDDADGRVVWQGLSGQLRTYTTSIENSLSSSASNTDKVIHRCLRELQETIGTNAETASKELLEENRQLRADVKAMKEQLGDVTAMQEQLSDVKAMKEQMEEKLDKQEAAMEKQGAVMEKQGAAMEKQFALILELLNKKKYEKVKYPETATGIQSRTTGTSSLVTTSI